MILFTEDITGCNDDDVLRNTPRLIIIIIIITSTIFGNLTHRVVTIKREEKESYEDNVLNILKSGATHAAR